MPEPTDDQATKMVKLLTDSERDEYSAAAKEKAAAQKMTSSPATATAAVAVMAAAKTEKPSSNSSEKLPNYIIFFDKESGEVELLKVTPEKANAARKNKTDFVTSCTPAAAIAQKCMIGNIMNQVVEFQARQTDVATARLQEELNATKKEVERLKKLSEVQLKKIQDTTSANSDQISANGRDIAAGNALVRDFRAEARAVMARRRNKALGSSTDLVLANK